MVGLISIMGILTLALQNLENLAWTKSKYIISLSVKLLLPTLINLSLGLSSTGNSSDSVIHKKSRLSGQTYH